MAIMSEVNLTEKMIILFEFFYQIQGYSKFKYATNRKIQKNKYIINFLKIFYGVWQLVKTG